MANTNRTKGHNAEREFRKAFRDMGYIHCETSRYASRMHDDCGIDLVNLPVNAQIKAGYKRGLNYTKVLKDMKERCEQTFGADHHETAKIDIIIHRKDGKRGTSRTPQDDLVVMSFEDFKRLLKSGEL